MYLLFFLFRKTLGGYNLSPFSGDSSCFGRLVLWKWLPLAARQSIVIITLHRHFGHNKMACLIIIAQHTSFYFLAFGYRAQQYHFGVVEAPVQYNVYTALPLHWRHALQGFPLSRVQDGLPSPSLSTRHEGLSGLLHWLVTCCSTATLHYLDRWKFFYHLNIYWFWTVLNRSKIYVVVSCTDNCKSQVGLCSTFQDDILSWVNNHKLCAVIAVVILTLIFIDVIT